MALSKSAKYYRKNKAARDKKQAYDKNLNAKPEQVRKRTESNKKRRQARASGKNIKGKDYNHGTNSFISVKANRGARTGTQGDRNARGRSL